MADVLKIGIVAGEQSGEVLAIAAIDAIQALSDREVSLVGVGGKQLASRGLNSLFDPDDIALMGLSSVVGSLPKLLKRISQTANFLIREKPDVVLLVDSPDFSHRVAKRLKAASSTTPIVKYVAPTVWAWRPERAAQMHTYIDHVLALFPFEPEVMEELGGPKTHYVGHPLARDDALMQVFNARMNADNSSNDGHLRLVCLPGSRSSEIRALMGDMRETIAVLQTMFDSIKVYIPTLERHEAMVHRLTADWPMSPKITTDRNAQLAAYQDCHVAVCASGTVTLELAMAGVPAVSLYRTDILVRQIASRITTWSAALPNIIADRPVITEFYDYMIRPGMVARHVRELANPTTLRHQMAMEGYKNVRSRMAIAADPATLAARVILDAVKS